jgi:C-methyltransferase C-terminal domain/Methyltransferase domain/Putative zinc binding domain
VHLKYRRSCRACGSPALSPVTDLGEQYLQGSFVKPGKPYPPDRRIPLTLVRCDPTRDEHACGLLQLLHSTPPRVLYSSYWYRSGTNNTMQVHLKEIAAEATKLVDRPGARALDIGSNDGTLLSAYPESYLRVGIDPSDIASETADDLTIVQDLFPSAELEARTGGAPFDIITSIAMFYDVEDPVRFVTEVKKMLTPTGIWIFEVAYMPTMLEQNAYDVICHEHLEYYSLGVLEYILERAGMRVFEASLNSINGGSIRCLATHSDNYAGNTAEGSRQLDVLRQREFELELDTDRPYSAFQSRIDAHREELRALLRVIKQSGQSIHVYGASTKGNVLLQWCGIDHSIIDCAADRNEEKHGARTLGTDIPIVSEEESRAMKPDYYLVLPWHFREEFLERERETIQAGVKMIFPLPTIEVVSRESLAGKSGTADWPRVP